MPKKSNYHHFEIFTWKNDDYLISQKMSLKKTGFTTYFNVQHILLDLSGREKCLLDYIIEHSDQENRMYIDKAEKIRFINFLKDKLSIENPPSINVLNKQLGTLSRLGLLIKESNQQSYYRVNPRYFWKGSESQRVEVLKRVIVQRIKNNLSLLGLIDKPEEEFLSNQKE